MAAARARHGARHDAAGTAIARAAEALAGAGEASQPLREANRHSSTRAGKNSQIASEATVRERDAVRTQTKAWRDLRRMIRKAVQGDPGLEKLYAEC